MTRLEAYRKIRKAMAPPCEKPAATMELAGIPLAISRSIIWLNSKILYGSTTLSGTARKMLSIWVWDSEKNSRWANTLATVILIRSMLKGFVM